MGRLHTYNGQVVQLRLHNIPLQTEETVPGMQQKLLVSCETSHLVDILWRNHTWGIVFILRDTAICSLMVGGGFMRTLICFM